jgi:D-alanyl-D-alanine carboxypeptidase
VIDVDRGEIRHQENADARRYPASLTKIMTLYLVFDELDSGRLKLDKMLPVSGRAARQAPSTIGLRMGQNISVKNAILALVTKSANDAAVVLAEALGGTEAKFAERMTQRARALGMSGTQFRNASGLPNSHQHSTARDMATLALAMLRDHPDRYRFFSTGAFEWQNRTFTNHNRLLKHYPGADGMKTGYIHASGFNMVASATRHGRRLIGVIFGGTSASARDRRMVNLLDQGFLNSFEADDMGVASANPLSLPPLIATAEASVKPPIINFPKAGVPAAGAQKAEFDQMANLTTRESWAVQVGAFSHWNVAHNQAQKAAKSIPALAAVREIEIVPGVHGGKKIYKSQLTGFNATSAQSACAAIKARHLPCVVVAPSPRAS